MLKKITAVIACLAIAASVIGCGKKAVTFDTSDWGDMEIRVAGYRLFNDDPLNYEFAAGADKFTEEYGTKVSFMVGGGDGLGDKFLSDMNAGKAVATHIAENTEVLKARAEEFNEKYVDGYEAK